MSTTPVKYTSFDFATLKEDFKTFLRNSNTFKDYNFEGSNIVTITELIAGMGDLFDFYINAMVNENYIRTADLYENINKIVENIGYNPSAPTTSLVTVNLQSTFDIEQIDDYFVIPKWSQFNVSSLSPSGKTIKYISTEPITYVAGSTGIQNFEIDLGLIQGETNTELFTGTGEDYQKFSLASDTAIEEYIVVTIDDVEWTKVDELYSDDVTAYSTVFTTRFNKDQRIEIRFGNDVTGKAPVLDSNISVTFIETLGAEGKIGINEITSLADTIEIKDANTDLSKGAITFTITQDTISEGGADAETIEDIRNIAPNSYKAQKRLLTKDDHKNLLLENFGNFIQDVKTLNYNEYFTLPGNTLTEETSGRYYNNIYLYILPKYSDTLSGVLFENIVNFLETYKITTVNYVFESFDYVYIDADISYKKAKTSLLSPATITQSISSALRNLFKRSNRSIGEEVKYSEILKDLHDLEGISSITLALSSDIISGWSYENIELNDEQFPKINNITVDYIGIGA